MSSAGASDLVRQPFVFCEQCGARQPAAIGFRRKRPPARPAECPDCNRFSCSACWPQSRARCLECQQAHSRFREPSAPSTPTNVPLLGRRNRPARSRPSPSLPSIAAVSAVPEVPPVADPRAPVADVSAEPAIPEAADVPVAAAAPPVAAVPRAPAVPVLPPAPPSPVLPQMGPTPALRSLAQRHWTDAAPGARVAARPAVPGAYRPAAPARDNAAEPAAVPRGPTRVGRFPGWLIAAASVFVVLLAVAWVAPSLIGSTSPEEVGEVGGVQSVPSATPAGSPAAATQGPSAEPAPSEPAPTVGSNAAPGTIDVGASKLIAWQDEFGEIRAHIVVVAQNPGGTPIAVAASQSRWHVVDDAGAPFASGRFAHAFPPIVKPGGSVLLIETLSATFGETDEVRGLEVEIGTEPAEAAEPVATLDVAGVTWREAPGGGLEVTGQVTNTGDAAVRDAAVAVVLRDAAGEIVGGAYDVGIGALEAGAVANFATSYPGTPPIDPATVANAEAVAIGVP